MLTLIGESGIALAAEPCGPDTVVIAAAATVDEAMRAWPAACVADGRRRLLVAETFALPAVLRAVRAGVHTMLRSTHATSAQLVAAVRAAHRGDGRLPQEVLVRLLASASAPAPLARPAPLPPAGLTARQAAVLALIADGHDNAAIARMLSCSEHTVRNVVYDLTARLQVRNRSHAVARAVRAGLI
jgi:DNA-binding NarL/FixJ family response regulator